MSTCIAITACSSVPKSANPVQTTGNPTELKPDIGRLLPVVGYAGMVVSDDGEASRWGTEILKSGGNAIDAAVATAFALAVTRPYYASLGGGGFLVYCPPPNSKVSKPDCTTIDYREMAPAALSRDFYVRDGKARTDLSQNGALASGVPGVVAGLLLAHQKFGTRPLAQLMSRPIQLARAGFRMTGNGERAAKDRWDAMNAEAKQVFGCRGKPCRAGVRIQQHELARVLDEIASKGHDGFYKGWVAKKIASGLKAGGGVMTEQDLAAYRAVERAPVTGRYRGYQVVSMPPPSSGGILLLQMLGYADRADRAGALSEGPGAPQTWHALTHSMALAFADRAEYLGDPDHVEVPSWLLDSEYLDGRWESFKPGKAALPESPGTAPSSEPREEPGNTTHFSVVDRKGGAVSLTTTVNDNFGSGFVPPGTGIVMNNEMDDFSLQPGTPNLFGLVGGEANAVAATKRPLSSMTPTIVRDAQGRVRLVLGAQGGPRIISSVFQAIVNRLGFGLPLAESIQAPRIHQQWKPATLRLEEFAFSSRDESALRDLGYELKPINNVGRMQAIERFPDLTMVYGVPDPRTDGVAIAE